VNNLHALQNTISSTSKLNALQYTVLHIIIVRNETVRGKQNEICQKLQSGKDDYIRLAMYITRKTPEE